MDKFIIAVIELQLLFFQAGCRTGPPVSETVNQNSESFAIDNQTSAGSPNKIDIAFLCENIAQMKVMPFRKEKVTGDLVYDGLIATGKEAVPCLVDHVTDTTWMKDPREAPHILDFTVGDAAVFLLHRITDVPIETPLPGQFRNRWKDEGVYAYFKYVEQPENRKQIQRWWKRWMKNNLNK